MNFCVVNFNESVHENYPGIPEGRLLANLPVWMDFTIQNILEWDKHEGIPYIPISCREPTDPVTLRTMVDNRKECQTLILRRSGNPVGVQWNVFNSFSRRFRGIVKVQVGSIPSDMYLIRREELVQLLKSMYKNDFSMNEFFDDFLFKNFERIVHVPGHSFLFRNIYEYYMENLKLREYFLDEGFLEYYFGMNTEYTKVAKVGEGGTVKNSLIGSGCVVEGYVENSIIFHDVRILPGAEVRGSVILPLNIVETGASIENTVILEGNNRTIGHDSRIGGFSQTVNRDYPGVVRKGLTVIGEGFGIPPCSRIGSGCLVSGAGNNPLEMEDGTTELGASV